MAKRIAAHFSPGRSILISLFLMITAGALALALPMARTVPISFIDLFFTATSATCVTGLFTIPLHQFTLFGKCIILALIQIGGIGIITMSLFFVSLFVDLGMTTQLMAGQLLEIESWKKVKKTLLIIFAGTLIAELIGAVCIGVVLAQQLPIGTASFLSFFHAVSAFCNAGISLHHGTMQGNPIISTILMILVFVGGLGFITWYEISRYLASLRQKQRYRFSLHSKIVLYGSTALLVASAIIFWILERENMLANMSVPQTILTTLFHVISFKSTGFLLVPFGSLQLATLVLIMGLSFIGSSPGSTGSGVKINTFIIFLSTIKASLFGKTSVDIRGRRIPTEQVFKANAIIALSFLWIGLTIFCLLITEQNWQFIDIVFESFSAFTNLGISTGITPSLSFIGKIFILLSMIVGRIGSVSFILALRFRKKTEKQEFSYPEERVMLG